MPAALNRGFDLNQTHRRLHKTSKCPCGFLRCGHGCSPARVQQTDTARDDDEHLFALEPGQRSADGFDRQPQIIRDVLPAHRQRDGLPVVADLGQALPPAHEEGRNLFFRGSPAQQP